MPKKKPTGDYEVGYCKPPVPTQFKQGQSGNPKGVRRQQADDYLRCLRRALGRRVSIPIDGKVRRMTLLEANAHSLAVDSAMGKPGARRELMKLMDFVVPANGGWTIIDARPVLEDEGQEETRAQWLTKDNDRLRAEIEELKARLEGRAVPDDDMS